MDMGGSWMHRISQFSYTLLSLNTDWSTAGDLRQLSENIRIPSTVDFLGGCISTRYRAYP
jgi:hypothetical protein